MSADADAQLRLSKIKRPAGVFWFDLHPVCEDADGTWLRGPVGTRWGAPHDSGTLAVPVVVLLAAERPWVAWWVGDPADRRLEIDVCLPPRRTDTGWRFVDLELDPVLHERDSRVEIEDRDEFEQACRDGWIGVAEAALARSTAEERAAALRRRDEPWQARGWHLLTGGV